MARAAVRQRGGSGGEGDAARGVRLDPRPRGPGEPATRHLPATRRIEPKPNLSDRSLAHPWPPQTVLVVHPFNASIASQLAKGGRALWGELLAPYVLPDGIRWKVVAPPQNLASARDPAAAGWREALDVLIRRVDEAGHFDLAAISCGGIGQLLGAHLRRTNRSSMYHGGALQMWFGVIGRRWDPLVRGLRNTSVGRGAGWPPSTSPRNRSRNGPSSHSGAPGAWVRPAAAEVPAGASRVEKGTYW